MKKIISIVLLALLLAMPTSFASADGYESIYVIDTAGVLTEEELIELDDHFDQLALKYEDLYPMVLVVQNYEEDEIYNINGTLDFDEYIEDLYNASELTGYLLVLSLDHFDYRLYNINDELDPLEEFNLLSDTLTALDEGDYKGALIAFADKLEQYIEDPATVLEGGSEYTEADEEYELDAFFFDFSGVVDENSAAAIEEKLANIREKTDSPAYIVVLDDYMDLEWNPDGISDFHTFAKKFYDLAEFNGVLLILSTSTRDWAIHAGDDVDTTLHQDVTDYMGEEVVKFLREDDYAGAFNRFAEIADETLTAHSEGQEYVIPRNPLAWWWIPLALGLGALIALGIMYALTAPLRTVAMKAGASSYLVNDSLNYHDNRDIFLYRNVVRTVREKSNSSGSSGSGGTTSSGKY